MTWYGSNSGKITHAVATKAPNSWGLYDMLGNAAQWCQDWYDPKYYTSSPKADPRGPATGLLHAVRGAGWFPSAANVRSAFRNNSSSYRLDNVGFRPVMTEP
jgi:formylglycine-generating enzyme required for sulfatase activity